MFSTFLLGTSFRISILQYSNSEEYLSALLLVYYSPIGPVGIQQTDSIKRLASQELLDKYRLNQLPQNVSIDKSSISISDSKITFVGFRSRNTC